MKLSKYQVELHKLNAETLEMLREWRNSDFVKNEMEFQEYISPEMQQKWFESINNDCNYYFLIAYQGEFWGMIHLSNIDFENKTAQCGLFLLEMNKTDNIVSIAASAILLEFAFEHLNLQKLFAKVKNDNQRAINYNLNWGFKLRDKKEKFSQFFLDTPSYIDIAKPLIAKLEKLYPSFLKIE
jgi:RimJ/RimL family protein N-acetyltransferase